MLPLPTAKNNSAAFFLGCPLVLHCTRSEVPESQGIYILSITKSCHTAIQNDHIRFSRVFLFPHIFASRWCIQCLNSANMNSIKCYILIVLPDISLIISKIGISSNVFFRIKFSVNCLFIPFAHFFVGFLSFLWRFLKIPYIF